MSSASSDPEVSHQDLASARGSQHDLLPITAPAPHSLYRVSSVTSVDALHSAIVSYIDSSPLYDFRLCSRTEILQDKTIWKSLQSAVRNKRIRGVTVNVQHPSIKFHCMSRPLHDAVAPMACDFLDLAKQVLPEHKSKLRAYCMRDRLASATRTRPWTKYNDTSVTYGSPGEKLRPTLVFVVGASETNENLVEDAKQWLVTGREAQLVVLIDIQEDREALKAHRKTKDFQDRFYQLVLNYAREGVINNLGIRDDFGEIYGYLSDSEPEDYLNLQNDLVQMDFVGPFEVTLELWAIKNGHPQRRSTHQVFPPRDKTVEFKTYDLIPQDLVDPDDDRTIVFDLSLYRQFLERGCKDLAYWRALDVLRPRPKEKDSEQAED